MGTRRSLAERMIETKGRSTGFDYLRIVLALGIVCWHSIATSYGAAYQDTVWVSPARPIVALLLPLFFGLSGFLVAGSLERTPALPQFLALRFLRIEPALCVEIALSALLLGPLLTTTTLSAYFRAHDFRHYFLNVVGDIHYVLPGLFTHNPLQNTVNGQLWTVPIEFECYLILTALALLRIVRHKTLLLLVAIAFQVFFATQILMKCLATGHWPHPAYALAGHGLTLTFISAVVIFQFRARIPFSWPLFVAATICSLIGLSVPLGDYFIAFPLAYMSVFIGLLNPAKMLLLRLGDLSYGVFLYGFPIQQLVASFGPWTHHWYMNLLFSIPLSIAFAYLSWNVIEKPALSLRRFLHLLKVPAARTATAARASESRP